MEKDIRVVMIAAATKALKYQKENPRAEIGEVINYIINHLHYEREIKIGAVAAASAIFHYKEKNPRAQDKEALQFILNESPQLIQKMQVLE